MYGTRFSILIGLIGNVWTLYALVYVTLGYFGVSELTRVSFASVTSIAALVEPILTYLATRKI